MAMPYHAMTLSRSTQWPLVRSQLPNVAASHPEAKKKNPPRTKRTQALRPFRRDQAGTNTHRREMEQKEEIDRQRRAGDDTNVCTQWLWVRILKSRQRSLASHRQAGGAKFFHNGVRA
ncbi:hypothetical protein ACSS6W_001295 [Trichoderma asperelloides]